MAKNREKYVVLAEKIIKKGRKSITKKDTLLDLLILPPFSLTHINRLTDDTGIIRTCKISEFLT